MNLYKLSLVFVFAVAVGTFAGCGSDGNTVIQPTVTYQPTDAEKANATRDADERERENAQPERDSRPDV